MYVCATAHGGHRRASDPLEVELQLVPAAMWVLGIEPGSSKGQPVRSTGQTCREPGFYTQHPHGSSQLSKTGVTGEPMHSSGSA